MTTHHKAVCGIVAALAASALLSGCGPKTDDAATSAPTVASPAAPGATVPNGGTPAAVTAATPPPGAGAARPDMAGPGPGMGAGAPPANYGGASKAK